MTTIHSRVPNTRNINRHLLTRFATAIIGWAHIDGLIAEFLSFLLKADRGSMYVINQTASGEQQLRWIRTLTDKFENTDTRTGLSALYDRIDETRKTRNALVHGLWAVGNDPTTALVQTVKLSREEWIIELLVTRSDLDELITDVEEIVTELGEILVRLGVIDRT